MVLLLRVGRSSAGEPETPGQWCCGAGEGASGAVNIGLDTLLSDQPWLVPPSPLQVAPSKRACDHLLLLLGWGFAQIEEDPPPLLVCQQASAFCHVFPLPRSSILHSKAQMSISAQLLRAKPNIRHQNTVRTLSVH